MPIKEILRPSFAASTTGSGAASQIKTVLVHILDSASAEERLESALSIARAASAHVTCLQTTPFEAYVAFDGFAGLPIMNDVMKTIAHEALCLRKSLEEVLRNEHVSWEYVQATGNVAGEILSYAALADLLVTGRKPRKNRLGAPTMSLLGDLLQRSRTPLLLPGPNSVDPTGPALIAWNGSFEAANAVRASLGLLKLASRVQVLHFTDEPQESARFTSTRLLEYLSRQGIRAELVLESLNGAGDVTVAAGITARARSTGAAYIVMGGYSHSRFREFLFGGVTRTMLAESGVSVVITQ